MQYHVEYGGLFAESVIISLLQQRGFQFAKSFSDCKFLWVPHTKVPWESVLESGIIVSCYPVCTALVRKDALRRTLRERLLGAAKKQGLSNRAIKRIRLACPDFIVLEDDETNQKKKTRMHGDLSIDEIDSFIVDQARVTGRVLSETNEKNIWVLKDVSTNNSLGVRFITQEELRLLLKSSTLSIPSNDKEEDPDAKLSPLKTRIMSVIAEEYIHNPVLLSGRKFHLRVNVLALGSLAVYVHRDVICHCACEPYSMDLETFTKTGPGFTHITNNCIQRTHPQYERKTHTILLSEAISRLNIERRMKSSATMDLSTDAIFNEMCQLIRNTFAVLIQGRTTTWPLLKSDDGIDPTLSADKQVPPPAFIPNKSSFELFGWDYILAYNPKEEIEEDLDGTSSVTPVVLEVNGGPALEGTAWPMMCRRVLGDALETIEMVLLNKCKEEGDITEEDNKGPMGEDDNDRLGPHHYPPNRVGDFIRVL